MRWKPTKRSAYNPIIDRITPIMAWSVWYKCYEIFERFSSSVTLIHESANSFTNVNVRAFISSTNVICLAYSAEPKNYIYSGTMIINIQPIADIATIPVHWDWLPLKAMPNYHRNKFFTMLPRTVIIRAIGYGRWKSISIMIRSHEMIRTSFTSRIRRIWRIRRTDRKSTRLNSSH